MFRARRVVRRHHRASYKSVKQTCGVIITQSSLGHLRRLLGEGRLVEPETRRQNQGRVVHRKKVVDDVKEAFQVAVLRIFSNRDECRRDVRRHANGVLDVEALQGALREENIRRGVVEGTHRLSSALSVIGAAVDGLNCKGPVREVGTRLREEALQE